METVLKAKAQSGNEYDIHLPMPGTAEPVKVINTKDNKVLIQLDVCNPDLNDVLMQLFKQIQVLGVH